jgi:hypothetical protein
MATTPDSPTAPTQASAPPPPAGAPVNAQGQVTQQSIAQSLQDKGMSTDQSNALAQQLYTKFQQSISQGGAYTPQALASAQQLSAGNTAAQALAGKNPAMVDPAANLQAQMGVNNSNMANMGAAVKSQNDLQTQQAQQDPNSLSSQLTRQVLKQFMPTFASTPGFEQASSFQLMGAIPPGLSTLVNAQVDQQLKLMQAKTAQQEADAKSLTAKTGAEALTNKGSPAQEAIDQQFGKDYAEYTAGGGAAQVAKSISQVQDALDAASKKGTPVATGDMAGLIQHVSPTVGNVLYPSTTEAKQQIEGAVATTLKNLFPGRILQSEVENTMSRVWNPQLPLPDNIKNSQALLTQLKDANDAKQQASAYYEKNGTLKGFQGKVYTPEDFANGSSTSSDAKTKDSAGAVPMTLNGKTKMVPANQVDKAKAMGATLVGG